MAQRRRHERPQRLHVAGGIDHRLIILRGRSATPRWCQLFRAPDRIGHEVIAQNAHPRPAHGADGVAVILDLLVAPRQAHHRLVIKVRRHILDRLEHQTCRLNPLDQCAHVGLLPPRLAGQGRVVHLDAGGADLCRKAQLFLGQVVKLPHRNPDRHDIPPVTSADCDGCTGLDQVG